MPTPLQGYYVPAPSLGVRPDLPAEQVGPDNLQAGINIVHRDGRLIPIGGVESIGVVGGSVMALGIIGYRHSDGDFRLVVGTDTGWWDVDGAVFTDISGTALTGSSTDQVVFNVMQSGVVSYLLGTNGQDTPMSWDGNTANNYIACTGAPIARTGCVAFDRFLLGNLRSGGTVHPACVDVSANKDFNSGWGLFPVILGDTAGEIVSMLSDRDYQCRVYKTDAIYSGIPQPTVNPFAFQPTLTGIIGPASSLSVVPIGSGAHLYLAFDGSVQVFDGVNLTNLGWPIHRMITRTADLGKIGRSFVMFNSERREASVFFVPIGGTSVSVGVRINVETLAVYDLELSVPETAGSFVFVPRSLTYDELGSTPYEDLAGIYSGLADYYRTEILGRDIEATAGNVSIDRFDAFPEEWMFETGQSGFDAPSKFKTVTEITHFIEGDGVAAVGLGHSDYGEPATLESPLQTISTAARTTGHRETGRFFSLLVQGDSDNPLSFAYRGALMSYASRGDR